MESYWPENIPTDRKKAIEELIRGREFASRLRGMLGKSVEDEEDGSVSAQDLVAKILRSFTETLSILKSSESDEVCQIPVNTGGSWGSRKSEESGESSKISVSKDRRGCYKRRKTSHTSIKVTSTLTDDGYAWRKYGQKVILNAKYPRNYYRCTHKFEQGCQATKQVQRTEDDPLMYRTTYHGHHTCKNLLKAPQIILDSNPRDSSFLLSFQSNDPNSKSSNPFFPLIKQEYKEDLHAGFNHNQSSSSDYLLSPDLMAFQSSGPMTVLSSGSDHGDVISSSGVYSCTASPHGFEMDMIVGNVDFSEMLEFDF